MRDNFLFNILPGKKLTVSFAYLTLLILLFNFAVHPAPGDLDASFGSGGISDSPGADFYGAYSVALQPDGKIVAGGVYSPGGFGVNGPDIE